MWLRWTVNLRKAVLCAHEEAAKMGNGSVSAEHLLLGLLRDGDGNVVHVLSALGCDPVQLDSATRQQVMYGSGVVSDKLEVTPIAMRAIEFAYEEARSLGASGVDTEYMLLGLIRSKESLAGSILAQAGADLGRARNAVKSLVPAGKSRPSVG